jgi:hypothetical protein
MNAEPCGPPEAHFSEWTNEEIEEPIEIVDRLELDGPIEIVRAPAPPAVEVSLASFSLEIEVHAEPEPAAAEETVDDDPYAHFIRTLAEVAVASGATMDARTIDALLESDAVATAWRAILRGESEDFSKCAATLDEWAAKALASILSAPQEADQLRRELRARGVAAFGLVDAA